MTIPTLIDAVILANHGIAYLLKHPHPPLDATDTEAVAHYGGPGMGLDLWRMASAVHALKVEREVLEADQRATQVAEGRGGVGS